MPEDRAGNQVSVSEELTKVLNSKVFSRTPRLQQLLKYIVEKTLAGDGALLKGYSIGVDVFDKPVDFDPVADTIVRVQARKLRNLLDEFYASEGRESALRITIPRGSYKPLFQTNTGLDGHGVCSPARVSLSILPFRNLSPDPSQEYLADAFTEEMTIAMSRFSDIEVRLCRLPPPDPATLPDISAIARRTGADYLLEGSVKCSEHEVRVTSRLVNGKSGEITSVEYMKRSLFSESLFDILEIMAMDIAARLGEPQSALIAGKENDQPQKTRVKEPAVRA